MPPTPGDTRGDTKKNPSQNQVDVPSTNLHLRGRGGVRSIPLDGDLVVPIPTFIFRNKRSLQRIRSNLRRVWMGLSSCVLRRAAIVFGNTKRQTSTGGKQSLLVLYVGVLGHLICSVRSLASPSNGSVPVDHMVQHGDVGLSFPAGMPTTFENLCLVSTAFAVLLAGRFVYVRYLSSEASITANFKEVISILQETIREREKTIREQRNRITHLEVENDKLRAELDER